MIVAVPSETPVTVPEVGSTDPLAGLLLVHVPGVVASLSVMAPGRQISELLVIAAGCAATVTVVLVLQPVDIV